ncbi:sentrin-specific protease 8-like [Ischnura elegans]|uniref:sentrin-specific protease 8-like n=1 Tax=Ischnura elegans TaxID=197161 RepID=UPI001ED882A9|nr:sentrin-specific protease 8-like [Ischnura elegans]
MDNPVVLSINDVVIRRSDVDILRGKHWINDSIIGLCFDHYENRVFADKPGYLFVSPEVTQCIKMMPESEIHTFLDPLNAKEKDLIFFPLNDCMDILNPGGSHWSLLVYSKNDKTLCHYDSLLGRNSYQANELSKKIIGYLGIANEVMASKKCAALEIETLQQRNYFDCGIHVICNVELLAEHMLKDYSIYSAGKVKPTTVNKKRGDLLKLIEDLQVAGNGETSEK